MTAGSYLTGAVLVLTLINGTSCKQRHADSKVRAVGSPGATSESSDTTGTQPQAIAETPSQSCPEIYRQQRRQDGYVLSCGFVSNSDWQRWYDLGERARPEFTPQMTTSSRNFCNPADFSQFPNHRLAGRQIQDRRILIGINYLTVCAGATWLKPADGYWPKLYAKQQVSDQMYMLSAAILWDICPGAKDRGARPNFSSSVEQSSDGKFVCVVNEDKFYADDGGARLCPSRCAAPNDAASVRGSAYWNSRYDGINISSDIDKENGNKTETFAP